MPSSPAPPCLPHLATSSLPSSPLPTMLSSTTHKSDPEDHFRQAHFPPAPSPHSTVARAAYSSVARDTLHHGGPDHHRLMSQRTSIVHSPAATTGGNHAEPRRLLLTHPHPPPLASLAFVDRIMTPLDGLSSDVIRRRGRQATACLECNRRKQKVRELVTSRAQLGAMEARSGCDAVLCCSRGQIIQDRHTPVRLPPTNIPTMYTHVLCPVYHHPSMSLTPLQCDRLQPCHHCAKRNLVDGCKYPEAPPTTSSQSPTSPSKRKASSGTQSEDSDDPPSPKRRSDEREIGSSLLNHISPRHQFYGTSARPRLDRTHEDRDVRNKSQDRNYHQTWADSDSSSSGSSTTSHASASVHSGSCPCSSLALGPWSMDQP